MCKEITNRLHLQGGFTMIFCLHLCTCIRDYTLLPPVITETNVYLVASKDFALQVQLPITTWAANCGKAIEPLLQFVYSKFEICAFNIFIVSCYRYCLWYLSHLSMKRHSLETEISQHECHSEKKNTIIMDVCIWLEFWLLNSYTLTSVCIFSILFSLNFSRCRQGEFVKQSRAFSVGKHFLHDCDLKVWLWGDTVRSCHP